MKHVKDVLALLGLLWVSWVLLAVIEALGHSLPVPGK